jgi:hypothetical protein
VPGTPAWNLGWVDRKEVDMNWKTIGLAVLLADFTALTAWVVWEHGVLGLYALVFANTATTLLAVDLVIALSLIGVWLVGDARERGVNAVPFLLLTAFAGSVGPLLYLVLREARVVGAHRRLRATA